VALLTLQGVEFLVDVGKPVTRKDPTIGPGYKRRFAGNLGQERRGFKREWTLGASVDTQANMFALRSLLNDTIPSQLASGDHWQLDASPLHWAGGLAWSDKGQNILTLGGSASLGQTGGKWTGTGNAAMPNNTSTVKFTGYTPTTGWTAGLWHNDAGTWHPYLFLGTQAGGFTSYESGASIANPSWLSVTYGPNVLKVTGTGTVTDAISDIWIYPFLAPTRWAAGMQALQAAQAWPAGGTLLMGGDLGSAVVKAKMPGGNTFESQIGSAAFATNNELADFVLREQ
jgi:hypothetical protein